MAKITEIIKVEEWQWKYWPMFNFNLKLDDGEYIKLYKKSKDAFKVGDNVNYKVVEPWKKWEEIKEYTPKKSYNAESNNRWAMVWLAYKIAFDKAYDWEDSFSATIQLANRIFEEAMNTFNKTDEPKEEKKELPHSDDLPF